MPGAAHLPLSLGSGLSLLCLGVLLGCTMCWWHRRRPGRPLGRQRVELGAALPAATVPVPVQQQMGEALGARAEEIPHGRASLPTLPFLLWQRRCTAAGTELPCRERSPPVPAAPGPPPRLHCELRYSVPEATLTVTVLGVSQLPQGRRGSRVKVALVPLCRRRSLGPARRCRFGPHGPEELRGCTLRFAVYARARSRRESFVGEVLFPCAEASWDPRAPSSYSWELASTKTKLSKRRSACAQSCSLLSSPPAQSCSLLSSPPARSCSLLSSPPARSCSLLSSPPARSCSLLSSPPARSCSLLSSPPARSCSLLSSPPARSCSLLSSPPARSCSLLSSPPARSCSLLSSPPARSCSLLSSPPARSCSLLSSPPALGQLLLLLQLQAPAGRIKVLLRKAENLARLSRLPGTPGHYIIVHLHHDGHIIDTKETKPVSGYNPVWNTPFLFNIPTGDTQQQELALEFIVMQARLHARGSALGRVQVGPGVPKAGMLHWRDMCSQAPLESERWHPIQPRPAP